ncbi:MAG: hypothetical protein GX987_01685 [Tissierellia bacterium]|nr:hypothetical protein [Tissierellia bacterium]
MKEKNIKIVRYVLLVLIIMIIVMGCKINEETSEEGKNEDDISINVGGKDYDILVRSENLSDVVVDLYGIDNATSIIFNDLVVIGVEMARDAILTDDVKEMIISTVLENDTMIRQVLITDNKKIFDQIEGIIIALMNGKPYDDQVKEINRIIEKLKKE